MVKQSEFDELIRRVTALEKLVARVDELEELVEERDEKIKALENELRNGKTANTSTSINWSNLFKNVSKKSTDEMNVVSAITAVKKDIEKRERNIVIVGVELSKEIEYENQKKDDEKVVNEILEEISFDAGKIQRIHRFKPKNGVKSSPILVELPSISDRNSVLKTAKVLKSTSRYQGVYINPDLNEAERKLTSELVKERNEKNKKLVEENKLNKPFRYGIRDNRVVQIFNKQ